MSAAPEPTPSSKASPKTDRWLGKTIAEKFAIEALIGEGAMGRVYRGQHITLKKPIAVKILHQHLGGDPRIAKRFHREAKAASRLSHPNSLQVIDFGEAKDGTLFIAMELLDGRSLQEVIEQETPFTPARIAELLGQVLRAVDEAHHAGIIHRDLKPENVVVLQDRDGERLKVCDFGIAKIVESEGRSTAITKDGYVCGTPEYMAPEQARGDKLDLRADVYAAGVVLYQMLCGSVPFRAETALGTITKHITEEPVPPRKRRPEWGIPRSLERIAMRAIAKSPDGRFESAAALSTALREAVDGLGPLAQEHLGSPGHLTSAASEADDEPDDVALRETIPAGQAEKHGGERWLYGLGLALLLLAVGIWLWARHAPLPPPPTADPATSPAEEPPPPGAMEVPPEPAAPPPGAAEVPPEPAPNEPVEAEPPPQELGSARPRPPGLAPRTEPVVSPGQTALLQGRERLIAGDLASAIERLTAARDAMPTNPEVHKQLGRAFMRRGDVTQGVAAYERYLELRPDAPDRAIVERIIGRPPTERAD